MSTVKVIVVTVEGGVDDVVQVCEQLRLSVPLAASRTPAPPLTPSPVPEPATPPTPVAPPPQHQAQRPAPTPTVKEQKAAARAEADGVRDIEVPPHPNRVRRPRHQLFEELAAIIPTVGDTVRVNDFVRDEAEKQTLKNAIDRHGGDQRFRWLRGIAGGARPARIRRERL